ncbi:MAG: hypothetical protein EXQ97_04480 [Alphaproteobacteria bacterium]|nr:hypothetical protein [Alphaproteobacteria bacterium]
MHTRLVARRLPPERLERAFALVRALDPALSVGRWRAFAMGAGQQSPGETGITVLETPDGYLHALFSWRRVDRLLEGPPLVAENLAAADLGAGGQTASRLAAAMEEQARAVSGHNLRVELGRQSRHERRPGAGPRRPISSRRLSDPRLLHRGR